MSRTFSVLILWSLFFTVGCSDQKVASPQESQTQEAAISIKKAQEHLGKRSFALAELEARKAVKIDPENQDYKLVLFRSLREQREEKLQKEAETLARELQPHIGTEKPESTEIDEFLKARDLETQKAGLEKAFDEKSPDIASLLDATPEEARDGRYWEIAFLTFQKSGESEKHRMAAEKLLSVDPKSSLAKVAESVVAQGALGLQSPESAFQAMWNKPSKEWKPFLTTGLEPEALRHLETLRSRATLVKAKSEGDSLVISLQEKNSQKTKTSKLQYKRVNGAYLLDPRLSDWGPLFVLLADSRFKIRTDFAGIDGIYIEDPNGLGAEPVIGPLKRMLGPARPTPFVKKISGAEFRDDYLVFKGGDVVVKYLRLASDPVQPVECVPLSVGVFTPEIRFASGLGVGNRVEDFAPEFQVGQAGNPTKICDGENLRSCSATIFRSSTTRQLDNPLLYTDRNGMVIGIGIPSKSQKPEPES